MTSYRRWPSSRLKDVPSCSSLLSLKQFLFNNDQEFDLFLTRTFMKRLQFWSLSLADFYISLSKKLRPLPSTHTEMRWCQNVEKRVSGVTNMFVVCVFFRVCAFSHVVRSHLHIEVAHEAVRRLEIKCMIILGEVTNASVSISSTTKSPDEMLPKSESRSQSWPHEERSSLFASLHPRET